MWWLAHCGDNLKYNLLTPSCLPRFDDLFMLQVEAMELDTLTPDMPALLVEMGLRYDPDKLAAVLNSKWPAVYGRAVRIAAVLGTFIAKYARDMALGTTEVNMRQR